MYESAWSFASQSVSDVAVFFPRLLGALLIFVIGAAIASWVRKFFVKILKTFLIRIGRYFFVVNEGF